MAEAVRRALHLVCRGVIPSVPRRRQLDRAGELPAVRSGDRAPGRERSGERCGRSATQRPHHWPGHGDQRPRHRAVGALSASFSPFRAGPIRGAISPRSRHPPHDDAGGRRADPPPRTPSGARGWSRPIAPRRSSAVIDPRLRSHHPSRAPSPPASVTATRCSSATGEPHATMEAAPWCRSVPSSRPHPSRASRARGDTTVDPGRREGPPS